MAVVMGTVLWIWGDIVCRQIFPVFLAIRHLSTPFRQISRLFLAIRHPRTSFCQISRHFLAIRHPSTPHSLTHHHIHHVPTITPALHIHSRHPTITHATLTL